MLNRQILRIPIHVSARFQQTIWFYLLLITGVGGISYLIYRQRLLQIQKLVGVRQHIATNLHDEVGSTMTLIALESDLINSDIYDDKTSEQKIQMIADKSREASKTMSDIVWSFDARQDHARDLIGRMRKHATEMLGPKGIQPSFTITGIDEDKKLDPLVRQNLYLIFKEAINNIVKHSSATQVDVALQNSPDGFRMTIMDNGQTVENAQPSSGQGMMNIEMRAKRISGTVQINNNNGYQIVLDRGRL